MDSADAVKVDVPEKADGFFKYILSFPDSAKHDVENMIQYILYAIIYMATRKIFNQKKTCAPWI